MYRGYMNQQIVDYLQKNKEAYTTESLVQQLRNAGYAENDIQEAVRVGDGTKKSRRIKIIIAVLVVILAVFFMGKSKRAPVAVHDQEIAKMKIMSGDTVRFNGYEVSASVTYDYRESFPVSDYEDDFERNLELWRQATQKINKIDDDYFNKHIFVDEVQIILYDGKKTIHIAAHLNFDWANILMGGDNFTYNLEGVDHDIPLEELIEPYVTDPPFYYSQTDANKFWYESDMLEITPPTHIVVKEQVESTIKKIAPSGSTYRIKYYKDDKRPIVSVFGKIDEGDNVCFGADIYLETGEIIDASERICYYTD